MTRTRDRLSVLFLIENGSVPGDARVWPECLAVKEAGFDVVVVCPQGTHRDRARFEISDGIEIHRFPMPFATGGVVSYVREYAAALREIRRLVRRLSRARSFALVHAGNPPDFLLPAAWRLKRHGARFIYDQHDLVPELFVSRFGPRRRLLFWSTRMVERLSFHLADVVISPNETYRRVAVERGAKRPGDVFVVRNAPDTSLFRPRQADVSLKRGKPFLLAYVGTMNRQDGLDHAIEALAVLRRKRSDWHVVFVGDGDAAADARRLSEEAGLRDLVDFTGFLPAADVVRVLTTADLCLSPEPRTPLNEASTFIKIVEYMAVGRPIVAFDLPESRVSAGPSAIYAREDDVESFASAIDELLDDPQRRLEMGRLGRERMVSELSWERSKLALLSAYDRALGRAAVSSRPLEERSPA